jgi:hypothetical protein
MIMAASDPVLRKTPDPLASPQRSVTTEEIPKLNQ